MNKDCGGFKMWQSYNSFSACVLTSVAMLTAARLKTWGRGLVYKAHCFNSLRTSTATSGATQGQEHKSQLATDLYSFKKTR